MESSFEMRYFRLPGLNAIVPAKGSRWRHKGNGVTYVVTGWTNIRSFVPPNNEEEEERAHNYPPTIIYSIIGCEGMSLEQFSMPWSRWELSMESQDPPDY
jgi:hypothetical protein